MADDFGIVPEGFKPKILRDCLGEIDDAQLTNISPLLDVSEASPDGMRNAIAARQEALVWELFGTLYEMLDPEKAEGALLISACKLSGTVPQSATFTTVPALVNVEAGTTLGTGDVFANVHGKPDVRFTPAVDLVAVTAGTYPVVFQSEFAGPVPCPAGTLDQISVGPSVGTWNAVSNATDGTLGEPADDDTRLRLRRIAELAAAGSSSIPALTTDIKQAKNLAGDPLVTFVHVFENATSATDSAGRPRNSIECLLVPSGTNQVGELASFLFGATGGGPTRFGLTSDTFTDTTGEMRTIAYTVPTQVLIFVKYTISVGSDFPGATAFEQAVATALNAKAQPGASFAQIWDAELAAQQTGVLNASAVTQGLTTSPVGIVDIPIGPRSQAVYDSSRVQVVIV